MRLIKGDDLTLEQRLDVLRRFTHRYTREHIPAWAHTGPYGQPYVPQHDTDDDWLHSHAFYIREDGRLATKPNHCEPDYLAD